MPLLMAKQQEEPSRVTAHGPIAVTPNLPFVACELCRERMSAPLTRCTARPRLNLGDDWKTRVTHQDQDGPVSLRGHGWTWVG